MTRPATFGHLVNDKTPVNVDMYGMVSVLVLAAIDMWFVIIM